MFAPVIAHRNYAVILSERSESKDLILIHRSMYRLATAAATTDTGKAMSVGYTYADDLLTSVKTPATTYSFTYGNFDLASSVKIGTRTLATTADSSSGVSTTVSWNGTSMLLF